MARNYNLSSIKKSLTLNLAKIGEIFMGGVEVGVSLTPKKGRYSPGIIKKALLKFIDKTEDILWIPGEIRERKKKMIRRGFELMEKREY